MSEAKAGNSRLDARNSSELITASRKAFVQELKRGLATVCEQVVEKLYSEAEAGASNEVRTRCHAAARLVSRNAERVGKHFTDVLDLGIRKGSPDVVEAEEAQPAELTLVDEDGLDEKLALDDIVSRADVRYSQDLYALNTRLSVLTRRSITNDNNPFGPKAVRSALKRVVGSLELEQPERVVFLTTALKPLLSALSRAYPQINDDLAAAGVLPNIRYQAARKEGAPGPKRPDSKDAKPAEASPTSIPESIADQMRIDSKAVLDRIHSLMDRMGTHRANSSSAPAAPLEDVDQTLAKLQRMEKLRRGELRQRLLSSLEATGRSVEGTHLKTIDLMGMVQEHIEKEIEASAGVKELFDDLQVPLIRVALSDPAFLHSNDHPARRFFETVARASELWEGDRAELSDMWDAMKNAVAGAMRGYDGDTTVFDDLQQDVDAHLKQIRRRAALVEKRQVAAREGKERLRLARTSARRAIAEILETYKPPKFPSTLLRKGWTDYIALCHMQGGETGESYTAAVSAAKFMAVAGGGKVSDKLAKRLREKLPAVEKVLRSGLPKVGFNEATAQSVVRYFEQILSWSAAHDPGAEAPKWTSNEFEPESPAVEAEEVEELAPLPEPEDVGQKRALMALEKTPFGTWFKLKEDNNWQKYKLSWFSPMTRRALLISPLGRTREIDMLKLSQLLLAGEAQKLVDEHEPIIDRALRSIWKRLKSMAGKKQLA